MSEDPSPSDPSSKNRRPFRPLPPWAGRATRLVHGGQRPELNAGAVVPPIYQSTTFRYPAPYSEAAAAGEVYLYSRNRNPTVEGPEELLRELEGGEAAQLFASGMGAISATILSLVRAGDEVVALESLYGGTTDLLADVLPRFGIRVRTVTDRDAAAPETVVSRSTRLALLETPTNPLLRVHDLRRWAEALDRVGGLLAVDNTFASPINQNPLALGADLVIHSATKYLGGHSDLLGGAVIGPARLVGRIDPNRLFGAPLDPFAAFLLHRSLRTLELRVAQQNQNAAAVVKALEGEPGLAKLHYPGRASPEEEAIAARQMRGRGGMLAISLRGGRPAVARFLAALRIVQVASSLGGVESLASAPRETSHRHLTEEQLGARGIDEGLVRLSLGIEAADDLARDLREAIAASQRSPSQ